MNALSKGILYGLAFFIPGILLMQGKWTERWLDEVIKIPVITKISQEFETGLDVAGDLFQVKADLFYQMDTIIGKSIYPFSDPPLVERSKYAWDRKTIEKKLKRRLRRKKYKSSAKYLDYIEEFGGLAVHEMKTTQVPASIKLAQGLLESNAGKSFLATKAKNHFGIKCRKNRDYKKDGKIDHSDFYHHELAYDCQNRSDDHDWDHFEMYEYPELSYRRHSILLRTSERYSWMFDRYYIGQDYEVEKDWFGQSTVPYYAAWAIGLKKSGYATSERYAQKVTYIIETYELWRIDYEVVLGHRGR